MLERTAHEARYRPMPGDTRTEIGITHRVTRSCPWAVEYRSEDGLTDVVTPLKWATGNDTVVWAPPKDPFSAPQ